MFKESWEAEKNKHCIYVVWDRRAQQFLRLDRECYPDIKKEPLGFLILYLMFCQVSRVAVFTPSA